MKRLLLISLMAIMCLVGKEVLGIEKCFLPDFYFLKESAIGGDFDPRNIFGERPRNFQEAKNNLRQIFYTGLADALKNCQLPIVVETLKQIEKVLDLASKFFRLPSSVFRFPFVPAILPTLKDFAEKLRRLINQPTTFHHFASTLHLPRIDALRLTGQALYTFCFLTFLSLSTIILRL